MCFSCSFVYFVRLCFSSSLCVFLSGNMFYQSFFMGIGIGADILQIINQYKIYTQHRIFPFGAAITCDRKHLSISLISNNFKLISIHQMQWGFIFFLHSWRGYILYWLIIWRMSAPITIPIKSYKNISPDVLYHCRATHQRPHLACSWRDSLDTTENLGLPRWYF